MKKFGLIGFPLSHSFSKGYFSEKFKKEGISDCSYDNYEIENVDLLPQVIAENGNLRGLNVTIPHKQGVIQYLDELHPAAKRIGAVNVIAVHKESGKLIGYNSDYFGFQESLKLQLNGDLKLKALVLGTGGASKAVLAALEDLGITNKQVSRKSSDTAISYDVITEELIKEHRLLINTTPLGMSPNVDSCPDLPYEGIGDSHYLFDLVYNPETTLFLKKGLNRGAKIKNGLEMLHLQAEKAWEIWNS